MVIQFLNINFVVKDVNKKGNVKIIPKNKKSFIANKIAEILLDKLLINDKNIN